MLRLVALLMGGILASLAPSAAPTPFVIPPLPISKAGAQYPNCRTEIIFVLDVSSSMTLSDQQTLMRFTVQFMVEVEKNVKDARFGVVVFGIAYANSTNAQKTFNLAPFGGGTVVINGPLGNRKYVGSEVALGLDHLRYNCTECSQVSTTNFSQLEYMWTLGYAGYLTPTWDGLDMAKQEYDTKGDPTVPGRFIVLLTDGVPNDANCYPPNLNSSDCIRSINTTDEAVVRATSGTLLLTVGLNLNNATQPLMYRWASEPKDIMAVPTLSYSELVQLVPKSLNSMCLAGTATVECVAAGGSVGLSGVILNTPSLACRFFLEGQQPSNTTYPAEFVNTTFIKCPLPANFESGTWNVQFTIDGRGFYESTKFKFGTACTTNNNTTNEAFCNSFSALLLLSLSLVLW